MQEQLWCILYMIENGMCLNYGAKEDLDVSVPPIHLSVLILPEVWLPNGYCLRVFHLKTLV